VVLGLKKKKKKKKKRSKVESQKVE